MFGVVDDTTTTKFVNRASAMHGISLPVVVDKVVVVVLKFPIVTYLQNRTVFIISLPIKTAMVLLKVSWRSLRRCMSILVFLWSAFLNLFALNFQPRFHVKLIFTLDNC